MTQRTPLAALRRSTALVAISLAFFACSDGNSSSNNVETEGNSLLVNLTVDLEFQTGELRWMSTDSTVLSAGAIYLNEDSKVFAGGENIFVLGRYPGTLACISPQTINEGIINEVNLGDDVMNPYGVTVIGNNGYIILNDVDYLQIFNVNTCALGDTINLPISSSKAAAIAASGDTLLVVLQRLNGSYQAPYPGLLVRIKASDKKLIDTIPLKLYNPQTIILNNGKLIVASQKYDNDENPLNMSIDRAKSGIEIVVLSEKTSEILLRGTELGGGISGIALNETTLYAIVYVAWGEASVKSINLTNKAITEGIPDVSAASDIIFDNATGKLFMADRSMGEKAGLKIYDTATRTTTTVTSRGHAALPPYSLAIARW